MTAAAPVAQADPWFGRTAGPYRPRDPSCLLFCLAEAGAGAASFRGWGPPYALYGHSLGARLAFDVARELRRLGAPAPLRLYAGAARPPDVPEPLAEAVDLPAEAFLAELEHRIDAPVEAFEHEEFRDLILPVLTAERTVRLEDWALTVLARRLAADEAIRAWLPARLPAQLALDGDRLLDPSRAAVKLSRAELALIEACDGVRSAKEAAALAAASPGCGLRSQDDALLVLDRLVERGLMDREIDLPVEVEAEAALRCALSALPDPDARQRCLEALDRLAARREAVAAAAGEPEALRAALDALDQEFADLCGHEPARRAGEMYAGRGLCCEETTRDLDVTVGEPVLRALAGPLDVLLSGDREQFLAGRAWRRALGLPDRFFAKIGSETKPVFADLSAPLYVDGFASMLRSARMAHGDEVVLTVSEMLPDGDQAWVPDAEGRRYVSELRLQIRDPLRVQAGQSAPERRNGSGR